MLDGLAHDDEAGVQGLLVAAETPMWGAVVVDLHLASAVQDLETSREGSDVGLRAWGGAHLGLSPCLVLPYLPGGRLEIDGAASVGDSALHPNEEVPLCGHVFAFLPKARAWVRKGGQKH